MTPTLDQLRQNAEELADALASLAACPPQSVELVNNLVRRARETLTRIAFSAPRAALALERHVECSLLEHRK